MVAPSISSSIRSRPLSCSLERTRMQAAAASVHRQRALNVGVEELGNELVLGVEQLLLRPTLDDLALPQDGDEIGDPAGGAEVVADHQVAAPVLLVHLAD